MPDSPPPPPQGTGPDELRGGGRYQLLRNLGGRTMAASEAYDHKKKRSIAFKNLSVDVDFQYLEWEVKVLKDLDHHLIAKIYDFGRDEHGAFLTMQLCKRSLRAQLDRHAMSHREVCELGLNLASALEAAHEAGLVHGFLTPENVLFSKSGTAKLSDFGFAHQPETSRAIHAVFLAPEQQEGQAPDARSDIFGLSAVLYYCLTREPPPLEFKADAVPAAFQPLLSRGLSAQAARRHGNATQFKQDLQDIRARLAPLAEKATPERSTKDRFFKAMPPWILVFSGLSSVAILISGWAVLGDWLYGLGLSGLIAVLIVATAASRMRGAHRAKERGDALFEGGKPGAALDFYLKAMMLDDKDPEILFRVASAYDREENATLAIQYYRACLAVEPTRIKAMRNLARRLKGQGKDKEAQGLYREILKISPSHGEAHFNLGLMAAEKKPRQAIEHFKQALEADPKHAKAHVNLANLLLKRKQGKKAVEHFQEALKLDPWDIKTHNNLATLLDQMGFQQKAEELYRTALKLDGQSAKIHGNLGLLLRQQGRDKEAEFHLRTAIDLEPENPVPHKNLADLFVVKRSFVEAEYHFREAIRLSPDYAAAHRSFAEMLHSIGRKKAAVRHYMKSGVNLPAGMDTSGMSSTSADGEDSVDGSESESGSSDGWRFS